jgi:transcription termination factor NusB
MKSENAKFLSTIFDEVEILDREAGVSKTSSWRKFERMKETEKAILSEIYYNLLFVICIPAAPNEAHH